MESVGAYRQSRSLRASARMERMVKQTGLVYELLSQQLMTLLEAFQLPANRNIEAKKSGFREYVGLVVDTWTAKDLNVLRKIWQGSFGFFEVAWRAISDAGPNQEL